jgi:hypothetical protein
MNDIDRYLDQACRQVNGPDSLRAHLRKELKEHLEEAIDALVGEGMSQADATAKAFEELGDPEIIRDGMESVYGPGVTSLFVDKAIKWRDRKWHIAAQVGLGLIIASAIGCTMFMLIYVVPVLMEIHEHVGIDVPAVVAKTIGFSEMVWNHYWIGLLVLIGGLGLFEWKYRSDNKAHMRTAIGVCLSLLSVLAAFWIMVVVAVSFAIVTPGLASARAQLPISQTPVQYGDHYYQVFEQPYGIEWNDAKTQCEALGGYLVIINDAEENAFLTSIGAGNRRCHLGASDADIEGDWRWVDGSAMTYQNWHEGEPINDPSSIALVENYLSADPAQWPKWAGGPSRAEGFICEWDRLPESNAVQRIEAEIGVE